MCINVADLHSTAVNLKIKNQKEDEKRMNLAHTHTHIVRTTSEWNVEQDSCEFI